MRSALNENPLVQRVVIGIGVVVLVILVLTRLGGGDSSSPALPVDPASASSAPALSAATGEAESITPGAASGAPEATPPAATPATTAEGTFYPGKGLPQNVVIAYAKDKAVVLLVVKKKGIDDRLVERAAKRLRARDEVAVFVTPATKIARYSQITQGLNVNRTPALVVVAPRSRTNSVPTGTVSFGFRSPASVEQTVDDALYGGPTQTYHPG